MSTSSIQYCHFATSRQPCHSNLTTTNFGRLGAAARREVVWPPARPHSLAATTASLSASSRVSGVERHNSERILIRQVRIETVVMLDEHETFARERGDTGFNVRRGPRRRESVGQPCDEAGGRVSV
jgi:hypothetical protein